MWESSLEDNARDDLVTHLKEASKPKVSKQKRTISISPCNGRTQRPSLATIGPRNISSCPDGTKPNHTLGGRAGSIVIPSNGLISNFEEAPRESPVLVHRWRTLLVKQELQPSVIWIIRVLDASRGCRSYKNQTHTVEGTRSDNKAHNQVVWRKEEQDLHLFPAHTLSFFVTQHMRVG